MPVWTTSGNKQFVRSALHEATVNSYRSPFSEHGSPRVLLRTCHEAARMATVAECGTAAGNITAPSGV
jgi:hypothetical protein